MSETNNRNASDVVQEGLDNVTGEVSDVADKSFKSVKDWLDDEPGPIPQFLKKFMIEPETGDLSPMAMTAVTGVALLGGSKFLNLTSNGDSTVDQVANPMGFIGKALLAVGLIGALFPMAAKWLGNVGADNGQDAVPDVKVLGNEDINTQITRSLPNKDDLICDEDGTCHLPSAKDLKLPKNISGGESTEAPAPPSAGQCNTILSTIPSPDCP